MFFFLIIKEYKYICVLIFDLFCIDIRFGNMIGKKMGILFVVDNIDVDVNFWFYCDVRIVWF